MIIRIIIVTIVFFISVGCASKNNVSNTKPKKNSIKSVKKSIPSITKAINSHANEINNCYEVARLSKPDMQGRVLFKLKIIQTGNIEEIDIIQNDFQDDDFIGCLRAVILAWKFQELEVKEINIVCPFTFQLN